MRNPFVVHRPPRARAVLGPFLAAVVLATLSPAHAAEHTPAPGVAAAPTLTLGEAGSITFKGKTLRSDKPATNRY